MLQDRKYDFKDDRIVNRTSGETIPSDEPVFVFRARDKRAAEVLQFYKDSVSDTEHQEAIEVRIGDFLDFASANPDRMKEPDTDTSSTDWE